MDLSRKLKIKIAIQDSGWFRLGECNNKHYMSSKREKSIEKSLIRKDNTSNLEN